MNKTDTSAPSNAANVTTGVYNAMHAIDELDRIKRDGFLTYFRFCRQSGSPDQQVTESVSVSLRTPEDPVDKCVARVEVEWTPYFVNASLAPRLKAEASNMKMLALFPEILSPFFAMEHGHLTPDDFVAGLVKIGVRPEAGNASYTPLARTCARCTGLFAPEDCDTRSADANGNICGYCVADEQYRARAAL
jgi:hypothetical protein